MQQRALLFATSQKRDEGGVGAGEHGTDRSTSHDTQAQKSERISKDHQARVEIKGSKSHKTWGAALSWRLKCAK